MRLITLKTFLLGCVLSFSVMAEETAEHDLEKAFYKEYSFLVKEKKAMQARIKELKTKHTTTENQARGELENLKAKNDALFLQSDRINDQLATVERETLAKESNQSIYEATLEQASATLNKAGEPKLMGIEQTIERGIGALTENTQIHTENSAAFYLQDGSEVTGQVVHFGGVARFGLSPEGQGPLAPAGGGAFKLWEEASEEQMDLLSQGNLPSNLPIFLYDSATQEVSSTEEKDVLTTINSGGFIAWVIVVLGVLAALLALLRGSFLYALGSKNRHQINSVSESVAKGEIEVAKDQAIRMGGSLKRVLLSTLNNIHRDREHVEDTISEAIIHEHTSLDRFHSLIMVIAAISPLLGLLGTVTGMIETFDIITEFGTGDPKLLSGGISIALVTTELGLIVAIPVLVAGTVLSSWANRIKDDIERSALHLVNQYHNDRS